MFVRRFETMCSLTLWGNMDAAFYLTWCDFFLLNHIIASKSSCRMTPAINKLSLESFEIKEYSYSIFIQLCYLTKNKPGKQWGQKHLAFLMATLENSALFHALLKVLFNIRQKVLFYLPC